MIGYPVIFGGGLDPDSSQYFQRAGITDSTAKQQINTFVRGVKSLGIWNNMVCWPLRSSHNAGTGTTAYSLGGLGTFNGTLVNGPTWGANGIAMTGGSEHIAWTKAGALNNSFSEFSNIAIVNGTQALDGMGHGDGGQQGCHGFLPNTTSAQARLATSTQTTPEFNADRSGLASIRGHIRSFRGTTFANHVIASGGLSEQTTPTAASGSVTHSTNTFFIGRDSVYGVAFNGTYHFYAFLSSGLTFSSANSFYNLYKSTLGGGLSLP